MKLTATRFATLLLLLVPVGAQSLPKAKPAELGFSAEKLEHVKQVLAEDASKGSIPGAVLLISRHGKIAMFDAVGLQDPGTKAPMTTDSIFRIYSMSKPITTVAAMTLLEEGKFALSDPVSRYIPSFAQLKVGVEKPGENGGKPTLD